MSAGETPRVAVGSVPSQGHCSPSLDKRLLVSSHLRLPDRLSDAARRQGGRCHPPPRLTAACPQEPPPPALGVWGQAHRQGDAAPAAAVSLRGRLYSIMCY